ncbi:ORFL67W [Human betaherpesvirus 5]|nr:ORFL67W [Human betaherpesvirus 5]QHX40376.1 ORFL67W [Human betaherpesvirus 5]
MNCPWWRMMNRAMVSKPRLQARNSGRK